ncbi:hypothetical protein D7Z54_00670 [Salibacterium salarium]|uniref:Competence protein ComK n=1 Tax=Salibacterium salarium TaxID=284579 RepID=A0A428N9V2_9BACI|nr:hypothetical protein D7Z54_00670 [Salibacterium salarium]
MWVIMRRNVVVNRNLLEDIRDRYEVINKTLALLPVFDLDIKSMIYETNRKIIFSRQTPLEIMEEACLEGGSSISGRIAFVREVVGIHRRRPVPVNVAEDIYAFPTFSHRNPNNCWIFYSHIRKGIADENTGEGIVIFFDGQQLPVHVSYPRLDKQILRTSRCKSICDHYRRY